MSLYSFIEAWRKENGVTKAELAERADISYATLDNIKAGRLVKPGTAQKLALTLGCSIGDLQAAMATDEDPRRVDAEKKSVGATAGDAVAADETPPEAAPSEKPASDMLFPVEEAPAEEQEETLAEFKTRIKDMCLREFTKQNNGEKAKILIAEKLLNELLR